jgi:hypothetical protein
MQVCVPINSKAMAASIPIFSSKAPYLQARGRPHLSPRKEYGRYVEVLTAILVRWSTHHQLAKCNVYVRGRSRSLYNALKSHNDNILILLL